MENFSFYSPTFFEFGKDAEQKAGELVKRFGGSKVLLHFGGSSAKKSGLLDRVEESLNKAGVLFIDLGGDADDIPKLVNTLCRTSGRNGSISGFVTLNEEDCTNIYKLMI